MLHSHLFIIEKGGDNMKLVTIRGSQTNYLGIKTDTGVVDLTAMFPRYNNMKKLIEHVDITQLKTMITEQMEKELPVFVDDTKLTLGPCITDPEKVICVGLNYRKHAEETQADIPQTPILFNKYNNTLAGHMEDIKLPMDSDQVDYEAELAIVIGKTATKVSKENAKDYVFGYCCANDISARDLQFRSSQWLLGKNLEGFCPLGPYFVTADEIPNPNDLTISCRVNGEVRQLSNTKDMIFHCDEIISYISQYMTLKAGDIILTGTPEGVVMGYDKAAQVWLRDGDEVTVEIEGLGKLTNVLTSCYG